MSDSNQVTAETAGPTINLVDLQNVLRIIDVSSERGAFKGNELSAVGQVRDKIASFLDAVIPKQEVTSETENTTSEVDPSVNVA